MVTRTWRFYFHNLKYLDYVQHCMVLLEQVRADNGKVPGYCHMTGQGPSSCLRDHVTGLLFGFYLKLFLPCIFNSVHFWSSMSSILEDIGLSDKTVNWELGVLIIRKVQA